MRDPVGILTNGIDKFRNKPFRIATLQGEYVIITSREQVAEYIRVGDDVLNMLEAADDVSCSFERGHDSLTDCQPRNRSNNKSNGRWAMESLSDRITLRLCVQRSLNVSTQRFRSWLKRCKALSPGISAAPLVRHNICRPDAFNC